VLDERSHLAEEALEIRSMLGGDEMPRQGRRRLGLNRPRLLFGTNHFPPHPWLWNMWTTQLLRLFQSREASTQMRGRL